MDLNSFPVGSQYKMPAGSVFEVVEHGDSLVRVTGCMNAWVGLRQLNFCMANGYIVPLPKKKEGAIAP